MADPPDEHDKLSIKQRPTKRLKQSAPSSAQFWRRNPDMHRLLERKRKDRIGDAILRLANVLPSNGSAKRSKYELLLAAYDCIERLSSASDDRKRPKSDNRKSTSEVSQLQRAGIRCYALPNVSLQGLMKKSNGESGIRSFSLVDGNEKKTARLLLPKATAIRSSQSQTSNSAQLSAATQTEFKRTLTSIGVQCGPVAIDSSSQTDELIGAKSAPSSASYHPHRGSRAPTLQAEAMPDCFTTPTGGGPITHRTVRSDAGYFDWPYADLTSGRATDGEPRPSVSAAPRTYSISNYPATQYHHVSELASSSSSLNAGGGGHDRMHMEQPQRSSGASHGRSQQQFRRTDCSAEERRHGFSVDNMVDTAQGLFSTASASLRPHLVGGSRQHDETFYIQNVIATDIAEARPSIPDASATGSGRLVGFSTESILAEPRNANLSAVAASRGRPAPQAQAKLAHTVENLLPPVPVSESGENRFETDTAHWYHGAASWANSSSIDPSLTAATVTTCNATVLPDLMFDNAVACTPNYHPVASHHRTMSPALMPPKATTYGSITSFSAESLLSSANSASASGVITESSLPSVSSFRGVDNRRGFDGLPSSCELPSFSSMIHSDADKSHRNRGAFFSIRDLACAPSPTNQSTFCQPLQSETSQAEPVSNTALMASTAPAVPWCPARSCIVPTDVEATLQTPTATPIGNQHAVRTSTIGSSGAYIDYPHYEHSGVYRLHPASINTLANYYQGQGDASSLNMAPPLSPDRRHGS